MKHKVIINQRYTMYIFIVAVVCLLVACTNEDKKLDIVTIDRSSNHIDESATTNDSQDTRISEESHDPKISLNLNPEYLDESLYSDEEREIVKVLNQVIKTTVDNDVGGYIRVLSRDIQFPENTESLLVAILSYETVSFVFLKANEVEVHVLESRILLDGTESEPSLSPRLYHMIKEEDQWKIAGFYN